jgi:thioesterase domain-containing protein
MTNTLPPELSTDKSCASQTRPLYRSEEAFWCSWQLNPKSCALNTPLAFAIEGPLNCQLLSLAVDHYCQHQHLETCAKITILKGQPHFVLDQKRQANMEHHHVLSEHEKNKHIHTIQHTLFDLNTGPLMRFCLITSSPTSHVFMMNCHHVVGDYTTGICLAHRIAATYNQLTNKQCYNTNAHNKHQRSSDPHTYAYAPHHNQAETRITAAHHLVLDLDHAQHSAIRTLAKSHHTTPFLLLISLWGWLLAKHHAARHLQLNYPIDRRPPAQKTRPGCFIEPCTITTTTQHQSLTQLIDKTHTQHRNNQSSTQTSQSFTHIQHLVSITPLTQTPFALDSLQTTTLPLPVHDIHSNTWLAIQIEKTTTLQLSARTSQYTYEQAKQWLHNLNLLITALTAQPNLDLDAWHQTSIEKKTTWQTSTAQPRQALPNHPQAMDTWQFQLLHIWQGILKLNAPLAIDQPINKWAVSSLQALQAMQTINDRYQLTLPMSWLLQYPSIAAQAKSLAHLSHTKKTTVSLLHRFQTGTQGTVIMIHPAMGGIEGYAKLLPLITQNLTLIGIDNPHLHNLHQAYPSIDAMAIDYIKQIKQTANGPYWLIGWSMGGVIAHAMAKHMQDAGLDIKAIYLLDAHVLSHIQLQWSHYLLQPALLSWLIPGFRGQQLQKQTVRYQQQLIMCARYELQLLRQHQRPQHDIPTVLFKAMQSCSLAFRGYTHHFDNGWHPYCKRFHIYPMPCHHFNIVEQPYIDDIYRYLSQHVKNLQPLSLQTMER